MATIGDRVAAQRKCESCGTSFIPKEDWHTKCFDCHKTSRGDADRGSRRERHERQPSRGRQNSGGGRRRPPSLPEGYLKDGYFDEKGNLRLGLVNTQADAVAKALSATDLTSTQLRRFFTMARSIEQKLNTHSDFAAVAAEVASLQPFAALSAGRGEAAGKDYSLLKQFIDANVSLAQQDEQAFRKGFLPHFQFVLCYFTSYKPKDR